MQEATYLEVRKSNERIVDLYPLELQIQLGKHLEKMQKYQNHIGFEQHSRI